MFFDSTYNPYTSLRNTIFAKNGMVATSQPLAAAAGLGILQQGGNAVDAAIATAACLTVVEPTSNGIGSDAFALVWIKGELFGLNASGPAPMDINIEKVKRLSHNTMPRHGMLPVVVPGAPAAWAALSNRFGKLSLAQCLQPAISYAKDGYPVSPILGKYWHASYNFFAKNFNSDEFKPWFNTFAKNNEAPPIGSLTKLPYHAKTLQEIGETNAKSFYNGRLADQIISYCKKYGGFLSKDDLSNYNVSWDMPISTNYRGYDIWEMPPNTQGIVALIALNILSGYNFIQKDSEYTLHKQFEAIKLAFKEGKAAITDPLHMKVSVQELLSPEYAEKLRSKINNTATAIKTDQNSGGTVYLATADAFGNMVSFIQSNYMGFGSGMVVPETGISLSNRGADFSLEQSHVNALLGGKKSYHTIMPGFITKNGEALGPFGVMGGYMQPQGHVQVVMNSIDFKLNPQMSLDAPRWQWISQNDFQVEGHFPMHIAKELTKKGHKLQIMLDSGSFGRGQIIWNIDGVLAGGTESRADGHIAAF